MSTELQLHNVPAALRERAQWLVWRFESKPGDKKPRKVPYYASGARRTGKQGSDDDRAKLVTFDAVQAQLVVGQWDGVGFAFLPGDGLIGIDLDKVIDADGVMQQRAADIIKACASFTELSPSGTGVHIYVQGETTSQKSDAIGVEVFCGRQFFTVTGHQLPDTPADVTAIRPRVLDRLHQIIEEARAKPAAPAARGPAPAMTPQQMAGRDRIESALACVSADCGYGDWIAVGMALYDALGEHTGLSVWDWWSSKGAKYGGIAALETHWRSFGNRPPGGDGVIFKMAMQAGWRPPRQQRPESPLPPPPPAGGGQPPAPPPDEPPPMDDVPPDPDPAGAGPVFDGFDDDDAWQDLLYRVKRGNGLVLMDCRENIYRFLRHHPALKGALQADTFARKIVIMRQLPWQTGQFEAGKEWTEDHAFRLGMWLGDFHRMTIRSPDTLSLAVGWAARESPFNPVQDYVQGLEWDRIERLSAWLTDYLGVTPSEYAQLSGTYFWVSLIARIMQPGAVVRSMPILEGPQFQGKSTVLRIIGGRWYSDTPLDLNSKDVYQNIQGVLLYEIAELDAFNKAESTRIKAFISSIKDRFRAPYDREPADHMRQTIFGGTTNQDEYFKDSTGNTRYWPWRTQTLGPIQLELLARDRDQLFAEAYHLWAQRHRWHPSADEQARLFEPEQRDREIDDPWEAQLEKWLKGCTKDRVTVLDVLTDCLKVEISKIDNTRQMSMRISQVMRRLGWVKGRETTGRSRERYYARPGSSDAGAKPDTAAPRSSKDDDDLPPF